MVEPLRQFLKWYEEARDAELPSMILDAMALSTATSAGKPSVRYVLYKGIYRDGFAFFTNYESRKARELDANPRAALANYWPGLEKQIRIEGSVTRLPDAESDRYFASRAYESRIGAWASRQSRALESSRDLAQRAREFKRRFPDEVPRPPHWGGYLLKPDRIEFWSGKDFRLHERELFKRKGKRWTSSRLYP
jgi:pyridoxamine 5'-phosphate oxidase